jgi:hypothetical protein
MRTIWQFKLASIENLMCAYMLGLLSKPTFSGSNYPLIVLLILLTDSVMAAIMNVKMAANQIVFC